MLEINGLKYSKQPFDGHKFRAIFEFKLPDEKDNKVIHIYTTDPNRFNVYNVILDRTKKNVVNVSMTYWTTKEKDEEQSKMLEAILLNWETL